MILTEVETDVLENNTKTEIDRLKSLPIIGETLEELRDKLPELEYHGQEDERGLTHTEDVLHDAILFALTDGIADERQLELIAIMAVFHDAGFLDEFKNNEPIGAKKAREAMRKVKDPGGKLRYTEEEIKIVSDAIDATKVIYGSEGLKQSPIPNPLAGYLLDADVSNFGRTDFREKANRVFDETQLQNPHEEMDKTNFLISTYVFLRNHQWNTEAAKKLRGPQQQINIQNLGSELGSAKPKG